MLNRALSFFLLRRDKSIIAKTLPKKEDNIVFCKMTPLQEALYRRLLASPDFQLLLAAKEECSCGSGKGSGRKGHDLEKPAY